MILDRKYQGIIFDFNGVILWDRKWHEQAWRLAAKNFRKKVLTRADMENHMHGRTTWETMAFLLGRPATPAEARKFLVLKEMLYQKIALKSGKLRLSPGAEKLFRLLEKNNIRKTIATSSPLMNIKFYYRHLKLSRWFPLRKIIYDTGQFPGKPAPDIYLLAAKKIRLPPSRLIVVEDASSGVESAQRAGIGKVIALAGTNNLTALQKQKPDKIIKNLGQISLSDFE